MNGELLILFVILLLGLILCSFLGVKEGMENAKQFYGPNGASAEIQTDSNGKVSLVVTASDRVSNTYTSSSASSNTYSGPNGATADVEQNTIQVKDGNGNIILTLNTTSNTNSNSNGNDNAGVETTAKLPATIDYDNYDHYNKTSSPTIFYGPSGATAKVIQTPNDNTIVITNKNGTTEIYYIDNNNSSSSNMSTYYGPNGGSAKLVKNVMGKQSVEITKPNGSKIVYSGDNIYAFDSQDNTINQYDATNNTIGTDINEPTYRGLYGGQTTTFSGPAGNTYSTYDSSAYYNSLPSGIPKSQIPAGEDDLYILKSQVVPPVCPRCPDLIEKCGEDKFDANKCPPCAPCARCPESSFECKKVPNYNAFNPSSMPMPALADFSTFGM